MNLSRHRSSRGAGRAVGLDIGATALRAVSLSMTSDDGRPTATLQQVASLALPPDTVVNGAVQDPAALTAALRDLWGSEDLGRQVVLGVASPQVVVRDLQIPAMEPHQQAKALPFLARDVIALPIAEVVLDFVPLGAADPESGRVDGLLVATPRLPVLAMVGAVERAGLHVARVDLASFAVLRSTAQEDLEAEAVVDLGAHLTTIVIHHRGVPRLVRTLARGGQELTERLAERAGLSLDEAETTKRRRGLTGELDEASSILREAVRPLVSEIRSSLNYFRSGNRGAGLERLALTGGGAALPGLAELLTEQVGAPAVVADSLQHVGDRWWDQVAGPVPDTGATATSLSVGLAMGAAA